MFRLLAYLVSRFAPVFLVLWGIALALGWAYAPSWDAVTAVGEVASLPAKAPSVRADELYRRAFSLEYSPSSVVLVFSRKDRELQPEDKKLVENDITAGLAQVAGDNGAAVTTIRSLADPNTGALLVSPDKHATIVIAELSTPFQEPGNAAVVGKIEALIDRLRAEDKVPEGLEVALTGSATAGRDLDAAEEASVHAIEKWTIVVVVALLLLLYRAPVVAFIPLVTVFVAVAVAIPFLTWLAGAGVFSLFRDLRVFITVLSYGAGVDYCVFLIARYREELDAGADKREAIARAIAQVGGPIAASAAVVIGGIGMLAFAQFAKIHQAGIVIPIALTIVLAATLTVGAALLLLAGRWAFWPEKLAVDCPREGSPGLFARLMNWSAGANVWGKTASLLLRKPGTIWLGTVAIMMPFVIVAVWHADDINFNPLSDLPANAPSAVGTRALQEHFPPGVLGPVILLVQDERIDFTTDDGAKAIARLTDGLIARRDELDIADVRSLSLPLGTSAAATARLAQVRGTREEVEAATREEALGYYVSSDEGTAGHVTRLDVTLATDPLTRQGIQSLVRLQQALPEILPPELHGSRLELVGPTASLRDLSDVKRADERMIHLLVPVVVFALLLVLFRRLVVSIYLIVSVLFSYFATLGLCFLVFRLIEGPDFVGLDWKVPIFLFTILVAVGEDYNIFLLTRVQEEQKHHGPLAAIPIALARTGRVISSCGFIMAGTFAALLSGSLRAMQELGFALAVGVLVDTLVVRPILVPAFLVLLQRLVPGRLGRYMALGKREDRPTTSPSQVGSMSG